MPANPRRRTIRPAGAKTPSSKSKPANPDFEFRWNNFRSIVDSGWVDVRPITIFIGPNSSGKSSLFAPLLLLKQTLESGD